MKLLSRHHKAGFHGKNGGETSNLQLNVEHPKCLIQSLKNTFGNHKLEGYKPKEIKITKKISIVSRRAHALGKQSEVTRSSFEPYKATRTI